MSGGPGARLAPSTKGWARVAGFALVVVLAGLAVWRAAFVQAGFDLDTDAYGHHGIARELAMHPGDLRAHWVWLPLWHYLQAIFVPLGATLHGVRMVNVLIAAASPLLLWAILRDPSTHVAPGATERREETARREAVAFVAALLTALSPIAMQMGTTGQTEPLDALFVLLVVWSLQRRRFVVASVVLGLGVMLRYEMWAVFLTTFVLVGIELVRPGAAFGAPRGRRVWMFLPLLVPAVVILAWAAVRAPVDGGWFKFLGWTQKFVHDALGIKGPLDRSAAQVWKDLRYYPYDVALLCFGLPLALVPFGFVRTLRREGLAFMGPLSAVLAFVTYAWLQRGSLGLSRHFVAIVPLYAACAAHGAMVIADGVARVAHEPGRALGIAVFIGLSVASAGLTYDQMSDWMADWAGKQRAIFTDRLYVGAFLRTLPPNATIYCDEPSLEVFSDLPYRRFRRGWIGDDEATVARLGAVAAVEGEIYVATWSSKLEKLAAAGTLVFRPPGSPPKLVDGLAVIRLPKR